MASERCKWSKSDFFERCERQRPLVSCSSTQQGSNDHFKAIEEATGPSSEKWEGFD